MDTVTEVVPVVIAIIENEAGKLLLMRRTPGSPWSGNKWNVVAGKIEKDEDPLDAVMREIEEETQLKVSLIERYPVYDVEEGSKVWRTYAFRFSTNDAEPKLNEEHTDFVWVDGSDIHQFELTPLILEDLRRINYIQ